MSVEADLLAAIAAGDAPSRDVYRDWLEAHAQHERAEYLRLGRALAPGELQRLREIATSPRIDPAWRRVVGRFPIVGCARTGCPAEWGALDATERDAARRCGVCQRDIAYTATSTAANDLERAHTPHVVDIAAASAWIRSNEWQSGNYTSFVRELYPEATGPFPITVRQPLRAFSMTITKHTLTTLFFGWSEEIGSNRFQSWSGLFATGPLGIARVSQRPSVVRDLLIAERVELPVQDPQSYRDERTTEDIAMLLAEAFGEDHNPDEWRPDRDLHMRSGLIRTTQLASIDTNNEPEFALGNRSEWPAIRAQLPGTTGRATPDAYIVSFAMAEAVGNGRVRFERVDVEIARSDYSFTVERTVAGIAACTAPVRAVIGRPFEVEGTARRAPLVRRDDWG